MSPKSRSRALAFFLIPYRTSLARMFDLTGKTVLITGAASGIGEAIAHTIAGRGAYVYVADIDRTNGERVVWEINASGASSEFLELNVGDSEQCVAAAKTVE